MNLRNLVVVTGVAALLFSLAFLLISAPYFEFFGAPLNAGGVVAAQLGGSVGFLYVFLAYFARNADEQTLRQIVGPTMFFGFLAQFLAAVYVRLTGGFNTFGWIFAVLGLIFLSAYAYLLWGKR